MFLDFYGLREQPFGVTPDPRFLYFGESHREALACLTYGIDAGRGFMALIAPPGMGKTTLLRHLMEQYQDSARFAFLFQQQSDSRGFMRSLLDDLEIESYTDDMGGLQRALNESLLAEFRSGRRFLLILDEAQDLDDSILETIRMLSNCETTDSKLVQIILSGQPQLADKLESWELSQLHQRISILARLSPFLYGDVENYIVQRLQTAGYAGPRLFMPEALQVIATLSGGIPRNINNICFHALSLGYVKDLRTIDRTTVIEAAHDLDLASLGSTRSLEFARSAPPPDRTPARQPSWQDAPINTLDSARPDWPYPRESDPPTATRSSSARIRWLIPALGMVTLLWLLAPRPEGRGLLPEESLNSLYEFGGNFIAGLSELTTPAPTPPADSLTQLAAPKPAEDPPKTPSSAELSETKVPVAKEAEPQAASSAGSAEISRKSDDSARDESPVQSSDQGQDGEKGEPAKTLTSERGDSGELRATNKLSLLYVNSDVSGATVYLDGKTKPGWKTPCVLNLPPGGYNVAFLKAGYQAVREWVDLDPSQTKRLVVRMKSASFPAAGIVVKTDPPGLPVFIDGQPRGFSEVYIELSPGRHTLKIVPPSGGDPYSGTFYVQPETMMKKTIRWPTDSASGGANPVPRRAS